MRIHHVTTMDPSSISVYDSMDSSLTFYKCECSYTPDRIGYIIEQISLKSKYPVQVIHKNAWYDGWSSLQYDTEFAPFVTVVYRGHCDSCYGSHLIGR